MDISTTNCNAEQATPETITDITGAQLPCLPNLTASAITMKQPWQVKIIDRFKLTDKAAYRKYITDPGTQDCLLSGVLGEAPNLRVKKDNRPAWQLAVVADYDTPLKDSQVENGLKKLPIKPNYISRSYSNGIHAVWLLACKLPIPPKDDTQMKLLAIIRKRLKLDHAFGPLDENAFNNLSQYYQAGWNWRSIADEPIPAHVTMLWLEEAIKKSSKGLPEVPLSVVAAEVQKRFPGRWEGDFSPGSRGVRFWDDFADCKTAAIVTETGMICYTGGVPFMSWEAIFGSDFVEKYRENTLGKVLDECFFVDNLFYTKTLFDGVETWSSFNRQSMESLLATRYGLRSRAAKDADQSEVKEAIGAIINLKSVCAARPFIYRHETIIHFDGQPVLNTSLLRVHPPKEGAGKTWGDGFPWIAALLESLFPDVVQRERFICEWAYAYKNAYAGTPKNGRIIFICGDVGVGKNFITEEIISPSLGGHADPSDYLLDRTRFTGKLFSVGVWVCNDTVSRGDDKERRAFTGNLKRLAANARHICEAKYKGAVDVNWSGRVFITLNTDPVSLQLLPELDQSNRDKISIYKVSGEPLNDPQAKTKAKEELGAVCAYLLNLDYPEHCRDGERWGVRGYLHPFLEEAAVKTGNAASFAEILTEYCKEVFKAAPDKKELYGTSSWYLRDMLNESSLKSLLKGFDRPVTFGRAMSSLISARTFPVTGHSTNSGNQWRIRRDDFEKFFKNGNREGGADDKFPF